MIKIALDFDGTVVSHEYPKIGKDIGAVSVLLRLQNDGVKFILNTMRSGKLLDEAVEWFKENGIELYGINSDPGQHRWTSSPKVNANWYIDDKAVGAPLISDPRISDRPFINWDKVEEFFYHAD